MNAIEVAQNNFNSWNRHDADAIVAAYTKLAEDWNRPEEDAAWSHLQRDR